MLSFRAGLLALVFAGSMLIHEALLEALFHFPDLPHDMALWSTTTQFVSCVCLPAILDLCCAQKQNGATDGDSAESKCTPQNWTFRSWLPYLALSGAMFLGAAAATHSQNYVDYTVKVVVKSSKLLPAMIVAPILGNSGGYTWREYVAAVLLSVGTASFTSGSARGNGSKDRVESHQVAIGMSLLAFSVIAEGTAPNVQQWLMRSTGASSNEMMLRSNLLGAVAGITSLTVTGALPRIVSYLHRVPSCAVFFLGIGTCLASAVCCYVRLIKEAGTVVAVAVATLRKSVTVMLSFLLFPGKSFTGMSALGLVFVAMGLVLAEWSSQLKKRKQPQDKYVEGNRNNGVYTFDEPGKHVENGSNGEHAKNESNVCTKNETNGQHAKNGTNDVHANGFVKNGMHDTATLGKPSLEV